MKDVTVSVTDNKVKVTHIPTNTVIESCQHKSHYKNKFEALAILRKALLEKSAS